MIEFTHNDNVYKVEYMSHGEYRVITRYSYHVIATFKIFIESGHVSGFYEDLRGKRIGAFSSEPLMGRGMGDICKFILFNHPTIGQTTT